MKRLLSLVLACVMLTSVMWATPVFAETVADGVCGESLTWVLDDEGTLTVSGTGDMTNWSSSSSTPWYDYKADINKVVIGEGVTSVSADSFWNYDNISEVSLSSTVKSIYNWAFSGCDALTEVTIPPAVEYIEFMAFYGVETIRGYKYSMAEIYAEDEEITFVSIGEMPEAVISSGECGDSATYTLTNRNVLTISGIGETFAYDYEESPWFPYMSRVKNVVIEEGITAIGDGLFNGCIHMTDLAIPEGVTTIGEMAFYGCWKVESLTLPKSLKTIEADAFNSLGITSLIIPEGVTTIGDYAFSGTPLEMVTIPESVVSIGAEAFGDGSTPLVITGVKGSYAESYAQENGYSFSGSFAEPVTGTFGDSLTWVLDTDGTFTVSGNGEMPYYSFHGYYPWYDYEESMKHIVIGDGVKNVSGRAFYSCSNVQSATISYTVTDIGSYAFYAAPSTFVIKGYTSSEAEKYAKNNSYTFESLGEAPCYELASGTCGDSLTWALDSHGKLTVSGNGAMNSFTSSSSVPWYSNKNSITSVVLNEGVTSLGNYAFSECSGLVEITLPESLETIGGNALSYCYNLPYVTVPVGVVSIGYDAFYCCGNYCETSFVLKGYTPSAAKDYAENNYLEFESLGEAPVATIASGTCGDNITWTLDNYGTLKIVGTGAMNNATEYDVPWYSYKEKILAVEISEGVTRVGNYAFYGCYSLSEVNLPESITTIGQYAFGNSSNLKKVSIHYNVTEIDEYAFSYSYNVVIHGYTGSVAEMYAKNSSLSFVSLGDAPLAIVASGQVTDTITWSVNNRGLLSITGSGDMPDYMYSSTRPWENYKNNINTVVIDGVDTVGEYTFVECNTLTSVEFKNVKEIDSYAFYSCRKLTEATFPPATTSISRYAFSSVSDFTIKANENTYAQMFAEYMGYAFEAIEGEIEIKTVYVSSISELIKEIDSNTEIIIEDGVYLLDRSSYLGDLEYTWEYADTIRIENVVNLTIKAKNPGKVEILAAQQNFIGNYEYENAPFYISGAYNLVIEGIRFGNMEMRDRNGYVPVGDDVALMGGYDENALIGYSGAYVTNSNSGGYNIPLQSKVRFVNCDIFNCSYAVTFYGTSLIVENCTLRDNIKGAVESNTDNVIIKDSVVSRNGCSERYRDTYCLNTQGTVTGCTFINNGNEAYASGSLVETNNEFSNNNWEGVEPKAYGVTQNSVTWFVTELNGQTVLKLGYTITSDAITIDSQKGTIYPYTVDSLPWKEFDIDRVDVAEGVVYSYTENGSCGETVVWSYDAITKTLTLSGKGNMSYLGYMEKWYELEVENIVIAKTITGVYNLFGGTQYFHNDENWEDGALYIGDVLIKVKEDVEGKFTIKPGTRIVADEAFHNCGNITEVEVAESVVAMGVTEKRNVGESAQNGVFENCGKLEKLTIPVAIKELDHALIYGCDNLKDIYYSGTKAQWENVKIGKNNDQLDYCTIHTTDETISPLTIYYTVYEDGVSVTGVNPFATEVVIPAEIDGVPVTDIATDLFVEHANITKVTIEANVTTAPYFTNSKKLEAVSLGNSVKYVNNATFAGCEKLASITLGDNIEEMSSKGFEDTAYYKNEANWDGGILYVDSYATILSDSAKGKVVVRSDARGICYDTFNHNSTVTEIVIPDGVKVQNLGEAFYNMSALESITLPDTFVYPEYGFGVYDCEKLANIYVSENHPSIESVDGVVLTKDNSTLVYMPMGRCGSYTVPNTVTTIGENSFVNTHLSAVTISEATTRISNGAFPYSYYLSDVYYNITVSDWESGNVYIGNGNGAFDDASLHLLDDEFIAEDLDYYLSGDGTYYIVTGCKEYLTMVTIPAQYKSLPVKEVDSYAFMGRERLTTISVDLESEYFTSVDGVLFTKDKQTLVAYPAGKADESYSIPEGVKAIGAYAFAYSEKLTSVDLGDEITNIGDCAFEGSGIKSVTIPETVTALARGVFWTDSLESVYFGTHIQSVTANTFAHKLKYIYFDGTSGEWRNVNGWYNIWSETQVITKVEVNAFAFKQEESIGIELIVDGADYEKQQSVVVIGLDKDGNQMSFEELYGEEIFSGYADISSEEADIDKIKTVKIFVWESLESMKPLGEPIEITVHNVD